MPEILRDAGLSALVEPEPLELIGTGFQFTEGPLWLPDGSLIFEDLKADRTYRFSDDDGVSLLRDHTHGGNGQTFGPDGRIYVCEQYGRKVVRFHAERPGFVEPVATHWDGKHLNSPNDIVAHPSGTLYFTDPPYGVKPEERQIHHQGVYALGTDGSVRLVVAEGFEKPNGLAFSPDGRTLYVADTGKYHVRAFEMTDAGEVVAGSDRVVATMDPGQPGGPDGMKVDTEGRLYVAVALGIWVFEPDGRLLGILAVPERPSNLAWCGRHGHTLAITAVDKVYRVHLKVAGLTPPFLPKPLPLESRFGS